MRIGFGASPVRDCPLQIEMRSERHGWCSLRWRRSRRTSSAATNPICCVAATSPSEGNTLAHVDHQQASLPSANRSNTPRPHREQHPRCVHQHLSIVYEIAHGRHGPAPVRLEQQATRRNSVPLQTTAATAPFDPHGPRHREGVSQRPCPLTAQSAPRQRPRACRGAASLRGATPSADEHAAHGNDVKTVSPVPSSPQHVDDGPLLNSADRA